MGWGNLFIAVFLAASGAYAGAPKTQLTVKATAPAIQESAGAEAPSFESANAGKTFYLGLVPHDVPEAAPAKNFSDNVKIPGKFDLDAYIKDVAKLEPCDIYDQGSCGSCVYNSVGRTLCTTHRARGKNVPTVARQAIMDCAQRQWMCSGSLGEYVAKGIQDKGGAPAESAYAYRARDQSCQGYGEITAVLKSFKVIPGTPQAMAYELAINKKAVSVTVAADGTWSGYSGGTYNGCSSMGTNHQVMIDAYDCETSVDADGNCVFDSNGYPKNGDGKGRVVNSWAKRWGVDGKMWSVWRGRSGQKCNNLAEEALVLETGDAPIPPTPPVPPTPVPVPFEIQAWMIYAILGLLVLVAAIGGVGLFKMAKSEHD